LKWYYEIAIGSPNQRGSLFPQEEIPNIIRQYCKTSAVYRSVYMYPETAVPLIEEQESVKAYFDERTIEYVPIDIDKRKDTDIETIRRTIALCYELENKYKIDENQYNLYFSGTGFHIDLPASLFNFSVSKDLPYIVKTTMANMLGKDIDASIYSRTGLYRLNYSLNNKSELWKIPIKLADLLSEDIEHIKNLSRTYGQSTEIDYSFYEDWMGQQHGKGELTPYVCTAIPDIKSFTHVIEPINIVTCVQSLYNNGPQKGTRNMASMRIASHFRRNGIPSEAAKAALLKWNHNSLKEDLIIEHVENVYNRNYKYGCEDPILKKLCNTRCIYYKNKDYSVRLFTSADMQLMAEERASADFTGKTIDIATLLGQPEKDCIIFPGELVTVYGPTGSGKTAFVQHLVLGLNLLTGDIMQDAQLDTVYLSLELSPQLMHRRNLQMVSNLSKRKVISNLREVYQKAESSISHVKLRVNSGDLKDIEELVRQLAPRLLVVDYLDLVESDRRSEHEQLKNICHGLSSIAVRYDIIVIAVAQIRRDDARERVIDIFSGKGSGAIENASRKIIGLNGTPDSIKKHLKIMKNTDGELMEAHLLHNWSTLRLSINPEEMIL
jgi:archaellum biogenesis ATPase FlaH